MREDATTTETVLEELSRASTDGTSESNSLDASGATDQVEREFDELLSEVDGALPTDEVRFDDAIVKENVEEILLMLIAFREESHGEQLISDVARFFETELSPGTIYPSLHDLEEEDVLSMHAKVRTKEYSVADEEFVRSTLERSMIQHLAFGLLMYAYLSRY
ncbi:MULTISPECIES: helix-turn-helix transcriptional regulator [Natrialba]|uniref:PadR family transcriptional regulator n=1 Tax=Natrialba swarupiae TaxID=2448032 RepID=A0A5D5AEY9_9EURY|nr:MULTISPECIES: helix-turn-helix transcriptional regulator [Natrialba]MWV40503.1 PadR family transcriptional regulator [Natrialba sp. INN-245]TYT60349.1 PadR family transcriptional regulator [Natrialba swarupiae]